MLSAQDTFISCEFCTLPSLPFRIPLIRQKCVQTIKKITLLCGKQLRKSETQNTRKSTNIYDT